MARILRVWLEIHEPSAGNPNVCVEVFDQARRATPTRVLHFGYPHPLEQGDLEYLSDVLQSTFVSIVSRTIGVAQQLEF
jgi:hypothetical protein